MRCDVCVGGMCLAGCLHTAMRFVGSRASVAGTPFRLKAQPCRSKALLLAASGSRNFFSVPCSGGVRSLVFVLLLAAWMLAAREPSLA